MGIKISFLAGLFFLMLTLLSGCLAPPEPSTPIEAIWKQTNPAQRQDTLFVFLPGRYDEPGDFLDHGFWNEMEESALPVDAVFVNAHLGYYYRQVLVERLTTDILQTARTMGYRQIWVVGISLGGLGGVLFDYDAPGWWDGLVLIAPFPGDKESVLKAIQSADSTVSAPLPEDFADDDYTAKYWHWLQDYLADPDRPLLLGYGDRDRLAGDLEPLRRDLAEENVIIIPGDHTWTTWRELWSLLVPRIREVL